MAGGVRGLSDVDLLRDLLDVQEAPAENEALRAWARDNVPDEKTAADDAMAPTVDAALPVHRRACQVCRKPGAAACLRCDAIVCRRHHHVMYGLCARCMAPGPDASDDGLEVDDRDEASSTRPELDIDWVDD